MELYIYTTIVDNIERGVLSLVNPDNVFAHGLIGRSIIGYLKHVDDNIDSDNIVYYSEFVALFHKTIKSTALEFYDLQKTAKQQQNGFINIVDQRVKDPEHAKTQDIIGAFEIKDGLIISDSYKDNLNYQIISSDGLFRLPEIFGKNLMIAMTETK